MVASTAGFRVLDGWNPGDHKAWEDLWNESPNREIFAHPDYVDLYSSPDSRPFCAVAGVGGRGTMLPFLLRDVSGESSQSVRMRGATDITSPYGFGGPFRSGDGGTMQAREFWREFSAWTEGQDAVSEFLRLGPLGESLVEYPGETVASGFNVVRDLTLDAEDLWMDVEHKVRKNVKKATRSGVTVEVDAGCSGLDSFLPIYTATMDRRRADRSYYFSRDFFDRLCEDLVGSYAFFHAALDGIVVSSELVLVSDENVYSFLGGTDPDAFSARPNDLLKYTIIEWAKSDGKKRFILGGGYRPDDGIMRYKLSFAPGGSVPFYVGRRILDERRYDEAVAARAAAVRDRTGLDWEPRAGYFPAYRA